MDCNPFGQNCSGAGDWYTLYHYLPTVKMRVAPQADSSRLKQTAGKGHLWPNISIILSQCETPAFMIPVCPSHMWCHPQQARFLERKHSHHVTQLVGKPSLNHCFHFGIWSTLKDSKKNIIQHSKITRFPWFPLKFSGKSPHLPIPPVSPRHVAKGVWRKRSQHFTSAEADSSAWTMSRCPFLTGRPLDGYHLWEALGDYPLVITYKKLLNMAHLVRGFPQKNVIFHSYVTVYQMVLFLDIYRFTTVVGGSSQ